MKNAPSQNTNKNRSKQKLQQTQTTNTTFLWGGLGVSFKVALWGTTLFNLPLLENTVFQAEHPSPPPSQCSDCLQKALQIQPVGIPSGKGANGLMPEISAIPSNSILIAGYPFSSAQYGFGSIESGRVTKGDVYLYSCEEAIIHNGVCSYSGVTHTPGSSQPCYALLC